MGLKGILFDPVQPGGPNIEIIAEPALPQAEPKLPVGRREAKAAEALSKELAREAKWRTAADTKELELAELERRAGEDVLAAADGQAEAVAEKVATQIAALRQALDVDRRTVAACAPKIVAARRAVHRARIADVSELLTVAERRKAAHDERLNAILAELEAHDGAKYLPWRPTQNDVILGTAAWTASTSGLLGAQVALLREQLAALELAVG